MSEWPTKATRVENGNYYMVRIDGKDWALRDNEALVYNKCLEACMKAATMPQMSLSVPIEATPDEPCLMRALENVVGEISSMGVDVRRAVDWLYAKYGSNSDDLQP